MAKAIITVTEGEFVKAKADSLAYSLAYGTAQAWAVAMSRACTLGGFALDEQEAFARAIVYAYAKALAYALADVTSGNPRTETNAQAFLDTNKDDVANTNSNSIVSGDSMASGKAQAEAKATLCTGISSICCVSFFNNRDTCPCGPGCLMSKIAPSVWRPMGKIDASDDCTC